MTPYAFKIARLIGGAVFSVSALESIFKVSNALPGPPLLLLLGLAAAGLAACVASYFLQMSEIDRLAGVYVSARKLKAITEARALALGIEPYHEYYRKRPEDDAIRTSLKTSPGVVILGKPSSGKTRAALEAIAENDRHAYVLSFTNPGRLELETIKQIILPSFFIFFPKPRLILLIDRAQKFSDRPFSDLFTRLSNQCSSVSIVATCRTGTDSEVLTDGELLPLLRDIPRVELGPLDPQSAADIYRHVWKEQAAPLTLDMTLPGLILRGPSEFLKLYEGLKPKGRRVITALGLAAACGDEPCNRAFLIDILQKVLTQDVTGIEDTISEMQDKYIVTVDGKDKLSILSGEFSIEDWRYYQTIHEFKVDLRKMELLLSDSCDAERLLQLGLTYSSRFRDFVAARRALETSLRFKQSALVHAALARTYLWLSEPEHARTAIQAAVDATSVPNEKAVTLLVFADEILFKVNDREKAAGWYAQAMQFASNPATAGLIRFRYADCLAALKRFSEAEPMYRDYLTMARPLEKNSVAARLFLCVLAQDRAADARTFLRQTMSGIGREQCLAVVSCVLENAEGLFYDMPPLLADAANAVWEEYREYVPSFPKELGSVHDSLLLFAGRCLNNGFLTPAVIAYRFLAENADEFRMERRDVASCLLNLGAALRDLQQFAPAREAFDLANGLAGQNPVIENLLGYSIAGLGDCALLDQKRTEDATLKYGEALRLGAQAKDEGTISWAHMGLGDIHIVNSEWSEAKKEHGASRLIPNSVSGYSRVCLGLARACFELGEFDDAAFYIGSGTASASRLDYRFRQKQFLDLKEQLTIATAAAVA